MAVSALLFAESRAAVAVSTAFSSAVVASLISSTVALGSLSTLSNADCASLTPDSFETGAVST